MTQLCSSSSRFSVASGRDGELSTGSGTVALGDGEAGVSGCLVEEGEGVSGSSLEEMEIQPARLNNIAIAAMILSNP
jgi:hypothetical protein